MSQTLKNLGERQVLRFLTEKITNHQPKSSGLLCGIGDDAAVLRFANRNLIATTDAMLEGVHFNWAWTTAKMLGQKILQVNLSDIAAMGGKPLWALISLAVPNTETIDRLSDFYDGLLDEASRHSTLLVGGDLDYSNEWKITVSLIGQVSRPVYRKTARIGNIICVTGFLGLSGLGLKWLQTDPLVQNQILKESPILKKVKENSVKKHLTPGVCLKESGIIVKHRLATAMMDLSDGLAIDLERLSEASQVGAKVWIEQIPVYSGFLELAGKLGEDPIKLLLSGGEDYELLFTAERTSFERIQNLFRRNRMDVCCIGEIVDRKQGVRFFDKNGQELELAKKGFEHFL